MVAADRIAPVVQLVPQSPGAEVRTPREYLVHDPHALQVRGALARGAVVVRRPRYAQQFTLPADREVVVVRVHHQPARLNRRTAQLFFKPVQLHLEPSDFLVQPCFLLLVVGLFAPSLVRKHLRQPSHQHLAPLRYLRGVQLVPGRQFRQAPVAPHRLQRHLRLKVRRVALAHTIRLLKALRSHRQIELIPLSEFPRPL